MELDQLIDQVVPKYLVIYFDMITVLVLNNYQFLLIITHHMLTIIQKRLLTWIDYILISIAHYSRWTDIIDHFRWSSNRCKWLFYHHTLILWLFNWIHKFRLNAVDWPHSWRL